MKIVKLPGTTFFVLDLNEHGAGLNDRRADDLFQCVRCAGMGIILVLSELEDVKSHMESKHHTPVLMGGETVDQAIERFKKIYGDCSHCIGANAPWTRSVDAVAG